MLQLLIMVTINAKDLLLVVVVAVVAAAVACIPLRKTEIAVATPSRHRVSLSVPGIWSSIFNSRALLRSESGSSVREAELLHTFLESAVMLLPGREEATVVCVFNFDVGYRVIVFDLNRVVAKPTDSELATIVPRTDIAVRHASAEELRATVEQIAAMSEDAFKSSSFPTLDLGVLKVYAKKGNVEDRIREALVREEQQPSSVAEN